MIKLILISLSVKGSDIRDFIKQLKKKKRWMFLAMDKKKFRIIQALYNADKDILRKKLIGIILEEQKQLNKSKDRGWDL